MIRRLHPPPLEPVADAVALHLADQRPPATDRPWVVVAMVTSLDGATALEGTSRGLADGDDRTIFKALRAVPDVVLVGAGTARVEDYRPLRLDAHRRALRTARGLDPVPRLAVVTASLDLDPAGPLFSGPGPPPYLLTTESADPKRRRALDAVAEVLVVGEEHVEVSTALARLRRQGHRVVLGEGGPQLNGHLVAAGLVDELALSLSPLLMAGPSPRLASSTAPAPTEMKLDRLLAGERTLFARYVRRVDS